MPAPPLTNRCGLQSLMIYHSILIYYGKIGRCWTHLEIEKRRTSGGEGGVFKGGRPVCKAIRGTAEYACQPTDPTTQEMRRTWASWGIVVHWRTATSMRVKIAHIVNKINKFLMLRELRMNLWLSLTHLFSFGSASAEILSRKDPGGHVDIKIQFGLLRKFSF